MVLASNLKHILIRQNKIHYFKLRPKIRTNSSGARYRVNQINTEKQDVAENVGIDSIHESIYVKETDRPTQR